MRTIVLNGYAPKIRDYCNTIVADEEAGVQYIFDSDGVYTTYTSKQQEGATKAYVDAKDLSTYNTLKSYADNGDANTLASAKAYTDSQISSDWTSKTYVDNQDAATLQSAKDYADGLLTGLATTQYVNQQDAIVQQNAASYTDTAISNFQSTVTTQINNAIKDFAVITMTDTDPGEGVPLAANHYIAVYLGEESE